MLSQPEQLAGLAVLVNSGESFANKTVYLANDMDLGNRIWTPIGTAWEEQGKSVAFEGTFDGQYHSISNFSVSVTETGMNGNSNAGFFGGVGGDDLDSGIVMNIDFRNAHVSASGHRVGIAVGALHNGSVSGVTTDESSTVSGKFYTGGIVGASFSSSISGCTNNADISSGAMSGGIVGYFRSSELYNCTNNGDISADGLEGIGGVIGIVAGENKYKDITQIVSGAINTGSVTTSSGFAGGVIGRIGGASGEGSPLMAVFISNSKNSGKVFIGEDDKTEECGLIGNVSHINTGSTDNITITVDGDVYPLS